MRSKKGRSHTRRFFPLVTGLVVLVAFLFLGIGAEDKKGAQAAQYSPIERPTLQKGELDTISISVVGDLMVGSSYPDTTYLPTPAEGNILQAAIPYLKTTDIRLGNLESAISDTAPLTKDCKGANCYAFRTPFKYAQWYKAAGFEYLNLANNHSFDFGMMGVRHTLAFLNANNIRHSGIYQKPYDTLTVRNTRIGFVSFAPHTNCLSMNDDSVVKAYINKVRPLCDLLIVFFHGGAEGATKMHVPMGCEIFLEQERGDLRHFTHLCIDEGADLVLGSGPHVVRGMEMYKDKLIAYSLGNFATYHLFNLKYPNNIAPLLQVRITNDGKLVDNQVFSFIQHGEGVPRIDTNKTAYDLIRSLSKEDFGFTDVQAGKLKSR